MRLKLPVGPARDDPDPLIIYHGGGCSDGFAAALAAWLYFDQRATFLALDHGDVQSVDDLPGLAGRAVYILDFSFSAQILTAIDERAAKLVMLDHHQSAAASLRGFQCRCGVVHFDMTQSGARLAWDFFFPDVPVPELVRCVEDRDLWLWRYAESAAFLAALDMEEQSFERWHALMHMQQSQREAFLERGRALSAQFNQWAAQIAQSAQPLIFNGFTGLMANAPGVFHSQVGHLLSEQSGTFALLWMVDAQGQVKCGLRSQSGFDCIAIAQSMGGGGHPQACGFRMPLQRLAELLSGRFDAGQIVQSIAQGVSVQAQQLR